MNKKFLVPFIASAGLLLAAIPAFAATPLSGYAWSSNIGWISFNPSDGATVALSTSSPCSTTAACLTGYAWSPNIGWVEFGNLSGFPGSGGNVTVNMSTGAVSGWARACAGTVSGDCSSMTSRADGWDGWIELSDSGSNAKHPTVTGLTGTATSSQGISLNPSSGAFSGYAWGSNVVGWLSFSGGSSSGGPGVPGNPVCITGPACPNSNPVVVTPLTASCLATVSSSNNTASINLLLSPSGGTGPYIYSWSNGSSAQSQTLATTYPESANSYSQLVSVTGIVKDSESPASSTSSISCGSVTIPAANQTSINTPTLWIGTNQSTVQTHILPGNNVTLGFAWPTGLTCTGAGNVDPSNSGWSSAQTLASSGTGSFTLNQVPLGIYVLNLTCLDNSTPKKSSQSNSVEIDVTPSTFIEK